MRDEIEVRLKPGATPEQRRAIFRAFARWRALAERARLSRRVRLIIRGGPCLSPEVVTAFWRAVIPPTAVEDVLVGGQSRTADNNKSNPEPSGAEADMPDAAAI